MGFHVEMLQRFYLQRMNIFRMVGHVYSRATGIARKRLVLR